MKKLTSVLLLLVVLCGTAFALPVTAQAAVNIDAADSTVPAVGSTVYYGRYPQTSLGTSAPSTGTDGVEWVSAPDANNGNITTYYAIEPIAWRVLANSNDELFLVAEKNIDGGIQYHVDNEGVTWERSTMRSWLNGYAASENDGGAAGNDYTSSNFINTAFTAEEREGINTTSVENADNPDYGTSGGNGTTDKIFLLSIAEANGLFADNGSRIAVNTDYTASKAGLYGSGVADYWWLRSPGSNATNAAVVRVTGEVSFSGSSVRRVDFTLRPALKINLSSVLFTSDASGASVKTSATEGSLLVGAIAPTGDNGYKLTITNTTPGFYTSFTASAASATGRTLTLNYSGAGTGANQSISAVVKSSAGAVRYYGQLDVEPGAAAGTVDVTIPDDFAATDTLHIFFEQLNAGANADYTSSLAVVTVGQQAVPTGLAGVAETATRNDGKITGLAVGMEYSADGGTTWTAFAGPGTEQGGLAPGSYLVRTAASGTTIASVAQTVTVGAYTATPTLAESGQNSITLPRGTITADKDFTFSATGDRQDVATGTVNDETRYVPARWSVNPSGIFTSGGPYTATTRIDNAGTYTLTVTYRLERWDGSGWQDTGDNDIKTATLTVQAASSSSAPSSSDSTSGSGSTSESASTSTGSSPQPGDTGNPGLWMLLGTVSVAMLGVVLLVIRRRKMTKE